MVKKQKKKIIQRGKTKTSHRLEKLFEYASDGLLLANDKGQITGINGNFLRLTGYNRSRLIGKTLDSLFSFEIPRPEKMSEWLKKKRHSGTTCFLLKTKKSERKYVTVHTEPLPGKEREFLISVHDITEERKLSLELQRTKDFLENMIQLNAGNHCRGYGWQYNYFQSCGRGINRV